MTKQEFIDKYIIGFLTSYAAVRYDENCQNGWPEGSKFQPVEDAVCLAEEAWDQFCENKLDNETQSG